MQQAIIGVFNNSTDAMKAKNALSAAGLRASIVENDVSTTSATDADEGGIAGFFMRLFGTDEHPDIEQYSQAASHGHPVLMVEAATEDQATRAMSIMESSGAINIEETAKGWCAANVASDTGAARLKTDMTRTKTAVTDEKRTIPVVEEEMHVGKRVVDKGGVRVYTRVVERPVEESVHLREERVIIERRPVERPATEKDFTDRERVFEIRTTSEEAVVGKTARVVEEVEVGREATERTETIRDTVRRTDVDVEQIDEQVKVKRAAKTKKTEKRADF